MKAQVASAAGVHELPTQEEQGTILGESYVLIGPDVELAISSWGASCRSMFVRGRQVIADPDFEDQRFFCGRVLAPWPNRVHPTAWALGEAGGNLSVTPGFEPTAIHGLVADRSWTLESRSMQSVTFATDLDSTPGYPFDLSLRTTYQTIEHGMRLDLCVRNDGDKQAPVGLGWHPYYHVSNRIDDASLSFASREGFEQDDIGIPIRAISGLNTLPLDLRDRSLDHTFRLDGTTVQLTDGSWRTELSLGPGWPFLHVYTSDDLPEPHSRRSIAIEPMTCPANMLNSADSPIWLKPGESVERWASITAQDV